MRSVALILTSLICVSLAYSETSTSRPVRPQHTNTLKTEKLKVSPEIPPELPDRLKNSKPVLPDNLPNPAEIREELRLLEQFLKLPEEDIQRIRRTIEKIEAMTPEEKERMVKKLDLLREVYQR